jgi:predicted Zn-ribbon and HTH transcriptional regulator
MTRKKNKALDLNECLDCGHVFKDPVGVKPEDVMCPKCGSDDYIWANKPYEEEDTWR